MARSAMTEALDNSLIMRGYPNLMGRSDVSDMPRDNRMRSERFPLLAVEGAAVHVDHGSGEVFHLRTGEHDREGGDLGRFLQAAEGKIGQRFLPAGFIAEARLGALLRHADDAVRTRARRIDAEDANAEVNGFGADGAGERIERGIAGGATDVVPGRLPCGHADDV